MGDLRCVGPGLNKGLQLPGVSERSDAEATASRMEMKLETRLSFTQPCIYRPLPNPAACATGCGLTSAGGKMGRGQDELLLLEGTELVSLQIFLCHASAECPT